MSKHIEGLRAAAKATRELPEDFDARDGYFSGEPVPNGFNSIYGYEGPCDGG